MIIQILGDAEKDLIDGFNFYESQESGLGDYFIDTLFSDIDSLHLYAGIHPIRFNYHRVLSQRFPFAIYYELNGDTVKIWAVLDCRRNPVSTEKRLENLELR
ncbi:MAG: type II toxin-antitoxin system RelE/ParE family toxin [Candidatus Sabulitectum sp.]|nr:type II toxin-antitoxin system RelE/ParE family toxin [Candidatus Sabulitectum sp.]